MTDQGHLPDDMALVPGIPADDDGPVFNEPWQAEVFALTLSLHASHLFTWTEWAETLSASIHDAQLNGDPDLGNTYYDHWLNALEKMLISKGIANDAKLQQLQHAWDKAARATPHGEPITLDSAVIQ